MERSPPQCRQRPRRKWESRRRGLPSSVSGDTPASSYKRPPSPQACTKIANNAKTGAARSFKSSSEPILDRATFKDNRQDTDNGLLRRANSSPHRRQMKRLGGAVVMHRSISTDDVGTHSNEAPATMSAGDLALNICAVGLQSP